MIKSCRRTQRGIELIRKYASYCKLQNVAAKHSDLLSVSSSDTPSSVVHVFRSNFAIFVTKSYLRISSQFFFWALKVYFKSARSLRSLAPMYKIYKINDGKLHTVSKITRSLSSVWIDLQSPTEKDLQELSVFVSIPEEVITDVKDVNEVPKFDRVEGYHFVLLQTPITHPSDDNLTRYTVAPLGILIDERFIVTITWNKNDVITYVEEKLRNIVNNKIFDTRQLPQIVLKLVLFTSKMYLRYLKDIHHRLRAPRNIDDHVQFDRHIVDLLQIEESLVYFNASLRSNQIVIQKIAKRRLFSSTEEDKELLEDVIDENTQGIEVVKVYSHIVEDIRTALSSLISTNLTRTVNWLTRVTVILTIPVLVASLYGMNVRLPFADWPYTFWLIVAGSIFLSGLITVWLNRNYK